MLRPIDNWYLDKAEPVKSCLLALRIIILQQDATITEAWKYGMPFFCINGKMVCYLWVHKKYDSPYLGIVEGKKVNHADLVHEKRARMKILLIDPSKKLPLKKLEAILKQTIKLYIV